MTTIQLHPRSLVLGLAIGACALFAMAQSAPQYASTVRVQYMPHPRDMVQIEEGTPYTVPVGKILVVTGLGLYNANSVSTSGTRVELKLNGQSGPFVYAALAPDGSVRPLPEGLSIAAGTSVDVTVEVPHGAPLGHAWGYLADQ